jgi:double-stranded uracil-DNA glycosylase
MTRLGPIVAPGLRLLAVGINPSLRSAEVGHHFARPGNRFWPAIHAAGWTPRRLRPEDDHLLPTFGVGVTNLAHRPTRAATDLDDAELRDGADELAHLAADLQPALIAFLGITAYGIGFAKKGVRIGLQDDTIGGRPVWVLPNPSGLNAHYKPADFARLYAEAWAHAGPTRRPAAPAVAARPPARTARAPAARTCTGTAGSSADPA